MDYKFPSQLFPQFYLNGLPTKQSKHDYAGWGSYEHVLPKNTETTQIGECTESTWDFYPQHGMDGEVWVPMEPVVTPLLPPNDAGKIFSGPLYNPENFPEQMQHFYIHQYMDAFSTMGQLVGEHFSFGKKSKGNLIKMGKMKKFMSGLNYKKCELGHYVKQVSLYHNLLGDVVTDIPPALLAELLHEELTLQRDLEEFQPATTGGALACVPFPAATDLSEACLIYPRGETLDTLNFHRVVLDFDHGKPPTLNLDPQPLVFNLEGTVRQISAAAVCNEDHIGVRSDYFCAAWLMVDGQRPRPTEVIQLKERSTCLNVSPYVPGELVVTSESGAAYLWTVKKGLQKFRQETSSLYFDARSPWRWCEFSAHPRVLVFADRTGAELTDIRSRDCSNTLFRIGMTGRCQSGERVILTKFLGESHAYHHLITTQFSAYLLDERMPGVPALKWEHMLESPPCFAQVLPAAGQNRTSKILLGARKGQETVLLQYSGGREQPCRSDSPVQKLCSPSESLKLRQLPHRQHKAQKRLGVPAAGLVVTQVPGFLHVVHLTEAGDLFYQTLKHHSATTPSLEATEPKSVVNSSSKTPVDEELSDSDLEKDRRQNKQVEVLVNDKFCSHAPVSDEGRTNFPESSNTSGSGVTRNRMARPSSPEMASRELKLIWKEWLESLLSENRRKKRCLKHKKIRSRGILHFKVQHKDKLLEDKFRSLRKDLAEAQKSGNLLLHVKTYLPSLDVTPVPDTVDPAVWLDDLSQRLSASWTDGYENWWEEKLGLNKESKIEALRRKRRREKQARARSRMSLSGSFVSSISYQDDLSDWSSIASQYLGSDADSFTNSQKSVLEDDTLSEFDLPSRSPVRQRASLNAEQSSPESKSSLQSTRVRTVASEEVDSIPVPCSSFNITSSQQNMTDKGNSVSLITSQPSLDRHSIQRWQQQSANKATKDYLSSLFDTQEPTQSLGQANGSCSPLPSTANLSLQSGFSFTPRQFSQPRTITQSTQPQRKKSRMGF